MALPSLNTPLISLAVSSINVKAVRSHLSLWLPYRVPSDSSIQKGNIRQRQKCLESQKQKNQESPQLRLSPCTKAKGEEAKSQVE